MKMARRTNEKRNRLIEETGGVRHLPRPEGLEMGVKIGTPEPEISGTGTLTDPVTGEVTPIWVSSKPLPTNSTGEQNGDTLDSDA